MERITLKIDGVTCGHCLSQVSKTLKDLDGVKVAQVQIGAATLEYDPDATSDARIKQAVEEQGYTSIRRSGNAVEVAEEKRP